MSELTFGSGMLLRFMRVMMVIGAFVLITALAAVTGPTVEGAYFPVVRNVKFELVNQDKDKITLSVTGVKIRSCRFIEVMVLVKKDGQWVQGTVDFQNSFIPPPSPPRGPLTRPIGEQHFGIWVIRPEGSEILFEVVHNCHPLWLTSTPLGIWQAKTKTAITGDLVVHKKPVKEDL